MRLTLVCSDVAMRIHRQSSNSITQLDGGLSRGIFERVCEVDRESEGQANFAILSGAKYLVVRIERCTCDGEILRLRTQNDAVSAEVILSC
jgi:hypothetical protein